jgi:hypothetical protein
MWKPILENAFERDEGRSLAAEDEVVRSRRDLSALARQREQFERDLRSTEQNFTDPRNQRRLRKLQEDEQRAQNDIGWLMDG